MEEAEEVERVGARGVVRVERRGVVGGVRGRRGRDWVGVEGSAGRGDKSVRERRGREEGTHVCLREVKVPPQVPQHLRPYCRSAPAPAPPPAPLPRALHSLRTLAQHPWSPWSRP